MNSLSKVSYRYSTENLYWKAIKLLTQLFFKTPIQQLLGSIDMDTHSFPFKIESDTLILMISL